MHLLDWRSGVFLEAEGGLAYLDVLDEHAHDRLMAGLAVASKAGEEDPLLDSEMALAIRFPEREKVLPRGGQGLGCRAAQFLSDDKTDMVVAGKRCQSVAALHTDGLVRPRVLGDSRSCDSLPSWAE